MKIIKTGTLLTASAILAMLFCTHAQAGFLVGNNPGAGGGNDTLAKVMEEIDEYNLSNDPDLIYPTSLFKKSDDDKSFVFDMSNGFMFFEDAAGTIPITSDGDLTSLSEAYFKYTGSDSNILFYSAKGPSGFGFSLYTFMSGLNFLDLNGDSRQISHVSFWQGPPGVDPNGNPIPEPSTFALLAVGFLAIARGRRRS